MKILEERSSRLEEALVFASEANLRCEDATRRYEDANQRWEDNRGLLELLRADNCRLKARVQCLCARFNVLDDLDD
jgi:hypothetical protein